MDLLATYGLTIAGAAICGLLGLLAAFVHFLGMGDWGVDLPEPVDAVASLTGIALPLAAALGAAVLVGPSSDLVNLARAVVGVGAGLVVHSIVTVSGISRTPSMRYVELDDGRVLRGSDADEYETTGGLLMARRISFPSDRYVEVEFSDGRSLAGSQAAAYLVEHESRLWPDAEPKGISAWAFVSGVRRTGQTVARSEALIVLIVLILAPFAAGTVAIVVADWPMT